MSVSEPKPATPPTSRPTAVAGSFYPAEAGLLHKTVKSLLATVSGVPTAAPKALIVPHAGYIYSGTTAAAAYACLREVRDQICRVILLGPAHRVRLRGLALPTVAAFECPLGRIEIDQQSAKLITQLQQVCVSDRAHANEHCLEAQLPFLYTSLTKFTLLPLVVGDASADEIAEVLEILWGDDETLIVVTSDLSHYLGYEQAQEIDRATANHIENLQYSAFDTVHACGARPLQGLLKTAERHKLQAHRLKLCNSGDTAGTQDRVVGYGAWSLSSQHKFSPLQKQILTDLARQSIEQGFKTGAPLQIDPQDYAGELAQKQASFVTLKLDGQLRGCIGSLEAHQALLENIAQNAYKAAFNDPRFQALTKTEFQRTQLSISILSRPQAINFDSEAALILKLRPGIDGLTIAKGARKATFLPAVWAQLPSAQDFLTQLKKKAAIRVHEKIEQAWCYQAETFD